MRVLEIGTGSGYNATLLVHLVGEPHFVTTIDIDADAIERAKHIIFEMDKKGQMQIYAFSSSFQNFFTFLSSLWYVVCITRRRMFNERPGE
jgi:SAM-dependent methyltransferase